MISKLNKQIVNITDTISNLNLSKTKISLKPKRRADSSNVSYTRSRYSAHTTNSYVKIRNKKPTVPKFKFSEVGMSKTVSGNMRPPKSFNSHRFCSSNA